MTNLPEVWLRGPLPNVPPLLQPVAHALLQARDEVNDLTANLPAELLWQRPAGVASIGFHLQHLTGVLDRLCTYARYEALTDAQLLSLQQEGQPTHSVVELVQQFNQQVAQAIEQLQHTNSQTLTSFRPVGRAKLPATVIGLLFHAAEHTMRHVGQLSVTTRMLLA